MALSSPHPNGGVSPRRLSWRLLVGLWILASLMSAASVSLQYITESQAVPWSRVWSEVLGWYLWLPLFPLVFWAARRFPIDRVTWRRHLAIHLALGALVATIYAVLVVAKAQVILSLATGDWSPHLLSALPGFLFGGMQVYLLVYGLLVAAYHALDYGSRYRERELLASRLESQLSRTHLQLLKMQLDPHLLFNALNAIAALVPKDPDGAERMIALLGDFLRLSLANAERQEVLLAEELDFLELYLEIERVRFADRLRVEIDVPPELFGVRVPNLVLQPLVENAVRHGRRGADGPPLTIRVSARARGGSELELRVTDDGAGLPRSERREGVGLSNTRARLAQLYGAEHRFELGDGEAGGAEAVLVIPRREADDRGDLAALTPQAAPATAGGLLT